MTRNRLKIKYNNIPLCFWKKKENFIPAVVPTHNITGTTIFFDDLPEGPRTLTTKSDYFYHYRSVGLRTFTIILTLLFFVISDFLFAIENPDYSDEITETALSPNSLLISLIAVVIVFLISTFIFSGGGHDDITNQLLTTGEKTKGLIDSCQINKVRYKDSRNRSYTEYHMDLEYEYDDARGYPVHQVKEYPLNHNFPKFYKVNHPIGLLSMFTEDLGHHYSIPYPYIIPFDYAKKLFGRVEKIVEQEDKSLVVFSFFKGQNLYVGAFDWNKYLGQLRPIPGQFIKVSFDLSLNEPLTYLGIY